MEKKVFMIHPFVKTKEDIYKLLKIDRDEVNLVIDDVSPDYLIASEHIYYHMRDWNLFVDLYKKAKINIFFAGECISPDMNIFDYAICFDRDHIFGDRICRMPTRLFFEGSIIKRINPLAEESGDRIESCLEQKSKFCNFIYSNANGDVKRRQIFDALSKYKRVDSLGKYLNNTKHEDDTKGKSLTERLVESIDIKKDYKFSIACENAMFRGYTSEKIWTSLQANTVPIYWGNPAIDEDVNKDAFINVNKYDNLEDVVEAVKEIDEDDEKWMSMVSQPWMTNEQLSMENEEINKYKEFMKSMFTQNISDAKRCGYGYHPSNYKRFFFEY